MQLCHSRETYHNIHTTTKLYVLDVVYDERNYERDTLHMTCFGGVMMQAWTKHFDQWEGGHGHRLSNKVGREVGGWGICMGSVGHLGDNYWA